MVGYLSQDADFVHSKDFEKAVTKVLGKKEASLNAREVNILRPFMKNRAILDDNQPDAMSFTALLQDKKRRRLDIESKICRSQDGFANKLPCRTPFQPGATYLHGYTQEFQSK